MKRSLCSKLPVFGVLCLFTAILALTSCENFLKSEQVKRDIISAIDYNNAKSYTIRVEAARGSGVVRIPAEGTVSKKVTDTFIVKFEPDDSCKFTGWKAEIPGLKNGEKTSDYIDFEDPMALETKVTFKKAHDSIVLIPDCPQIPTATINIEGSHGKFSPAKGEMLVRQGFPFTISYEPDSDYDFIKWKIYDSVTGTEYNSNEYLQLTHPDREETECLLLNAPEVSSNIKLCLEPVIVKRPRVISVSPQSSDSGIYRDARIRIVFDKVIEEKSIYYSKDEITILKDKYSLKPSAFLNAGDETNPKIYAYIFEGQKYYKNIVITNQKTEESLLNYYGVPYFEDSVTLIIPPDADNPPPPNTKITVTLESEISYFNNKSVSLKEDYKWLYFVNSRVDRDAPEATEEILVNSKGDSINSIAATDELPSQPYCLYDQKLKMYVNIKDPASGPLGTFKLKFEDVNTGHLEYKEIGFDQVEIEEAFYGKKTGTGASATYTYAEYSVAEIPDGNYKMSLIYYDKNINNSEPDKYYYVRVDATAPAVSDVSVEAADDNSNTGKSALKLNYSCSDSDFDKVVIRYKTAVGSDEWQTKTFAKGQEALITNLTYGVNYSIDAKFYDTTENSFSETKNSWTKLDSVKNLTITSEQSQDNKTAIAHLIWESPAGEFNSYTVKYKNQNTSENYIVIDGINTESCDISSLKLNEKYEFVVETIQNVNVNGAPSVSKTERMSMHKINIEAIEIKRANSYGGKPLYICVSSNSINAAANTYTAEIYCSTNENFSGAENVKVIYGDNITTSSAPFMGYTNTTYLNKYDETLTGIGSTEFFRFGTTYYFKIKITNEDNSVEWSSVKHFTIQYELESLELKFTTGKRCRIGWQYPQSMDGLTNVTTKIYVNGTEYTTNGSLGATTINSTNYPDFKNQASIRNLELDTQYNIEVRITYSGVTTSKAISVKTSNIPEMQIDSTSMISTVEDNGNHKQIRLNWYNPSKYSPSVKVDRYVIECKRKSNDTFGVAENNTNLQINGLQKVNNGWNGGFASSSSKTRIEAVITEYMYPKGSGWDVANIIANDDYDIMITGYLYNQSTGSLEPVIQSYTSISTK